MANLNKRTVESLEAAVADFTIWDDRLKGFGVRVFPSGQRKFVVKYRTLSGQQRKLGLGTFPVVTAERARELALKHLADVAEGGDPAGLKRAHRQAQTVAELCDDYFEACDAGLVLGRGGRAKRASTIYIDKGRVERHVKPQLGRLKARDVKRADIERFKAAVVTGKTAADVKTKRHGRAIVKGGRGTATRALGLLGAIFKWGMAQGHVEANPVAGVQRFADAQRKALLTAGQYRALGAALDGLAAKRDRHGQPVHHPFGLACIRFIALTGVRKSEARDLKWSEVDLTGSCLRLGDTKTGASIRPLGKAARTLLEGLARHGDYVFPAPPANASYKGLERLWRLVQREAAGDLRPRGKPGRPSTAEREAAATAKIGENRQSGPLDDLGFHALRHSFAGTAEALDCSLPTIAALLGHRLAGVTGGYILKRLDGPLIASADRVAGHIQRSMSGAQVSAEIVSLDAVRA